MVLAQITIYHAKKNPNHYIFRLDRGDDLDGS